ncbi:VOC family protein [Halomarina pelagica]|uniref:VOC family protein n=1 Tax=Halomarina pelagica TaxID=2961599 RepID=UPI0020C2D3B6|nr:VOC family protein [Halomarina sp. BND7]
MDPHVSLVTLGVSDLDRSIEFYRDGLGLPMRERTEADVAFFTTEGAWLALYPVELLAADANAAVPTGGGGFGGITLAHNVASRADVDAVVEEAETAGAEVVKSPRETDWGGYAGYFADPDGYRWEVAWNPHFEI